MGQKALYFQTNVSPLVDAHDERRLLRALARPGIVNPNDLQVVMVGAGTTLQVQVNACTQGGGIVIGGQDTHQGSYFGYLDAPVILPVAPADAVNPRIDTVVARSYDDEVVPGAGFAFTFEIIRGVPAAVPAAPALPRDCLALANVAVAANAIGIVAANITDRRTQAQSHLSQQPQGIIASGTPVNAPPVNSTLTVNNVVSGAPSWLAANVVTVPAGAGGLFLISVNVYNANTAIGASSIEVTNAAGASFNPILYVTHQLGPTAGLYWQGRLIGSWVAQAADGATFKVVTRMNPSTSLTVERFSVVRLGDALAGTVPQTLLRDRLDDDGLTKPADEPADA